MNMRMWKSATTTRMTGAVLAGVMACALSASAMAQTAEEKEQPDVGSGYPRTTLAYAIANPDHLMRLAGWDGEKFFWFEEAKAEAPMPPEGSEGAEGEMPKDPAEEVMNYFTGFLKTARRLDVALIDVVMARPFPYPKMSFDVALGAGIEVDLKPAFLTEQAQMEVNDAVYNGIDVVRYDAPLNRNGEREMPFSVFAFTRLGHLYLCISETVVDDLTRGLSQGPAGDGESLQENSRFSRWYNARKSKSLQFWLNVNELRAWGDRLEDGAEEFKEFWRSMDELGDASNWDTMSFGLDYNESAETLAFDFGLQTKRDLTGVYAMSHNKDSYALTKYLPGKLMGVMGWHQKPMKDTWPEMDAYLRKLGETIGRQMERQRKEQEEWERRWNEPERMPEEPKDEDGHADAQEEPQAGEGEAAGSANPYDQFMNEMRAELAKAGLTLEEIVEQIGDEVVFGMPAPEGESMIPFQDVPVFAAMRIADQQKTLDIIRKAVDHIKANQGEDMAEQIVEVAFGEGVPGWNFNGMVVVVVTEDALLLTACQQPGAAEECLNRMLSGEGAGKGTLQEQMNTPGAMFMGFDIHMFVKKMEDQEIAASRSINPFAEPIKHEPWTRLAPAGMTVSVKVDMQKRGYSYELMLSKFNARRMIEGVRSMDFDWDMKEDYGREQLMQMHQKVQQHYLMNEKEVPATFDKMIEDGAIRYMHVQSMYDSRFKGAEQGGWFIGDDITSEWFQDNEWAKIVLANEAQKFTSYTLVEGAKWTSQDNYYIVAYQTTPSCYGGRQVLYSNGHVGWLHDSVWEEAMKLTKAGEPIESPEMREWRKAMEDMPGEDMPGEEGMPESGDKDGIADQSEGFSADNGRDLPEDAELPELLDLDALLADELELALVG